MLYIQLWNLQNQSSFRSDLQGQQRKNDEIVQITDGTGWVKEVAKLQQMFSFSIFGHRLQPYEM